MSETRRNPKAKTSSSQVGKDGLGRPRHWLEPVILLTLREWNSYGYELMKRAVGFGFGAMNPGTMYRTLRELEENGVVKSKWETSGDGPARRMYSITDAGEAYLEFWAKSLEQYQRNMDAFFQLYTGGASRKAEEKEQG